MLVLPLLLILAGAADSGPQASSVPVECDDAFDDCRETCTLQFGASVTLREKLALCFGRCESSAAICKKRQHEARTVEHPQESDPKRVRRIEPPSPPEPLPPTFNPPPTEDRPALTVQPPKKKAGGK